MSGVVVMRQEEPLRLDPERLADMFVDLGERRAADLIALSLARLEALGQALDSAVAQMRRDDCAARAGDIAALSEALGLVSLAQAAQGVAEAAGSGDPVALAATWARLRRIAARSHRIAAELQHRSG